MQCNGGASCQDFLVQNRAILVVCPNLLRKAEVPRQDFCSPSTLHRYGVLAAHQMSDFRA
jgi:hypothetical protein